MIRCEGLTKFYGNHQAISDVSFHVKEGEIVGFLGPNAAGKTTTMRILTSYLPPTSGTASVAGHDVLDDSLQSRRALGYLPETCSLYDDMRVIQYLRFCAGLRGMGRAETRERIEYVLDTCGLEERQRSIIGTLSRGFRQRVGLAQALLHNPPVLILDEPTVGLDPNQIIEVRELIKSLAGEHTIMLSTHILPEAQMTCERVIIINHGRVIAEDTPQALTAQLRSAETVALTVRDDDDSLPRMLRDIPQVLAVRPDQSRKGGYFVDMAVGSDVRAEIAEFVVNKGWGLLELRPVEMTLEDVFRQLTTEEEGVE
ncbi:MAG: ATP-binding cassette domain-containing protein [Armatimonadetes bacterium]|nr:ATP-binding cassette domain-containing protein [Armatimonadota bacterium]